MWWNARFFRRSRKLVVATIAFAQSDESEIFAFGKMRWSAGVIGDHSLHYPSVVILGLAPRMTTYWDLRKAHKKNQCRHYYYATSYAQGATHNTPQ